MIAFLSRGSRFCLDLRAGQLLKGNPSQQEEVPLPRKPWEVLRYLAERPGAEVTRDELLTVVWGSDGANVGGNSVDQAISQIRDAIGDHKPHQVIKTLTGRGYRFAAPLEGAADPVRPTPPPASLDPYATVPPLPATFFERPEITEPLREKLVGEGGIVGIAAVEGMGGVGKTLIAIGLCHDPRVRQSFPDGIVWLTIGKESRVQFGEQVQFIAHALNASFASYSTVEYQSLLKDRSVLVVLDDVWELADIEPFRVPAGRSRLLYTSRNRGIAGPLGAENQDVGVLEPEQARRFLKRWSGREKNSPPEPFASGILDQCQGLALGLAMMGAALKGQPDSEWEIILDDLQNARLKEVGTRPGGYAYRTLHAAIEVGVNALPPEDQERYSKLAILLEDMPAGPMLLQQLWGGDQRKVHRVMRLLADRSLARRDGEAIRLHDFQLDYLRGEHTHPEALALLRAALLLSSHVIQKRPQELGSQLTGRLLAHRDDPAVTAFIEQLRATAPRPCLRPLWPALTAPGGVTQRILEGHAGGIRAVAITADGKRAISGSDDNTLRVWDLEGRQAPRVLEGHAEEINAVAMTADGKRAISGSDDNTLRVWDLEGRQAPRVLEGHAGWILAVAMTADGKRAISGSSDNTLRVWDLEGRQAPRVLEGHAGRIFAVAITADGKRAISGSSDNTLRVWDLEGQQAPLVLEGHAGRIRAVAITADGKRAISGCDDNTLRVWDLEGQQAPRVLQGHAGAILAVAITADGKRAISGSSDHTLRVWDLEGRQAPRVLEGHADWIDAVAITADGKRAISGSNDKTLWVWDLEGQQAPRVLQGHARWINAVAMTADGKRAISGSNDNTLRVWDLEGQQAPLVLEGHADWILAVAIAADGKRAISGSSDNTLRVWDLEGQQAPRVLEGHADWIRAVALTADGKRAISGSDDATLRVWDLEGQQAPRVLEGHAGWIMAVALTADGKRAISGSSDNTLRVWDLERGQCLTQFTCDSSVLACATASGRIVAGDAGGNLHVFAWEE